MAKISGPLLSHEAHGTIWDLLTFSKRNRANQVRYQKKQADVTTADRTTQRDFFIEAYEHWQTLTQEQQQAWNDFIYD